MSEIGQEMAKILRERRGRRGRQRARERRARAEMIGAHPERTGQPRGAGVKTLMGWAGLRHRLMGRSACRRGRPLFSKDRLIHIYICLT